MIIHLLTEQSNYIPFFTNSVYKNNTNKRNANLLVSYNANTAHFHDVYVTKIVIKQKEEQCLTTFNN